jgi:hypothetical protein
MGVQISTETFGERDYARFSERLEQCLTDLGQLLGVPGFGVGPVTIGAELELFLIDGTGGPLPCNRVVRATAADPRITLELDRFNLELNTSPVLLAGRPFGTLGGELTLLLDRARVAAGAHRGRIAMIGILPTLGGEHLGPATMTDAARYRALDRGLRRLRRGPLCITIAGEDPLELVSEHVGLEGANTSFQVHLRANPASFSRIYNAAQLATAPVLAVAGNSPTFLGHRLWEETRIALFKQAVEDRRAGPRRAPSRTAFGTGWLRGGPLELFTESVRLHEPVLPAVVNPEPEPAAGRQSGGKWHAPPLDELRLHQGTVWRWNRAIYDPAGGGHLRIEMRALPAGPTVTDMLANAAFLIGLTLWVANQDPRWTYTLPFERAEHGFYRAAQFGLAAELSWPSVLSWPPGRGEAVHTRRAAGLATELLPAARCGLRHAGVAAAETDRLLGVISARLAAGQTGAVWQRAALAAAEEGRTREQALRVMLDRYLVHSAIGEPVHTWPAS